MSSSDTPSESTRRRRKRGSACWPDSASCSSAWRGIGGRDLRVFGPASSRSGISCFLLALVLPAFHVLRRQTSTTKGPLLGTSLALVFVAAVAWVGIDAIGARFSEVDWTLGGRAGATTGRAT